MFGFIKKAKDFVVTNAVAVKNLVAEEISDVMKESKEAEQRAKEEEEREKNAKLPWEGLKLSSNTNGNFTDIVKEEILALSGDEKNFLIDEENFMFEFDFDIEKNKFQAMKIMEADDRLGALRNQLVPKIIDDVKFWKNYFYQIQIIKMKYANKDFSDTKNIGNDDALLESEEIEVDIDQLERRVGKEKEIEMTEKRVLPVPKFEAPINENKGEESKEVEANNQSQEPKLVENNEGENENLDIEIKL